MTVNRLLSSFLNAPELPGYSLTKVLGGHLRGKLLFMPQREHLGYLLGKYEPHLVRVLEEHIDSGMVCYDIGYLSLVIAQLVGPQGQVVSFEANAKNFRALKANLEVNGVENIIGVHKVVSDKSKTVRLTTFENSLVGYVDLGGKTANHTFNEIEALSIDDYVFLHGNAPPAFIKIDIAGVEANVFHGLEKTMYEHRPVLLAEVRNDGMGEFSEQARQLNYSVEVLTGGWNIGKDELIDVVLLPTR